MIILMILSVKALCSYLSHHREKYGTSRLRMRIEGKY